MKNITWKEWLLMTILLICALMMCSCNDNRVGSMDNPAHVQIETEKGNGGSVYIQGVVKIEGCQYFVCWNQILVHKGNCSNPIHYGQKATP